VTFDPHAPLVVGNEWHPTRQSAVVLAANGNVWADRFTSTVTEDIDTARFYFPTVATPGKYVCEIYEQGDEPCGPVTTHVYRPNADAENISPFAVGFWENELGSSAVGVLYQSIDEVTLDSTKYLEADAADYGARYGCFVASGAHPLGERVIAVRQVMVLACFGGNILRPGIKGTDPVVFDLPEFSYFGRQEVAFTYPYLHPFTGMPWTGADVQDLDGGNAYMTFQHASFVIQGSRIEQAWLEVDTIPENRVALGAREVTAVGWNSFTLEEPDGTDNWPKADTVPYSVSVRRTTDPRAITGGSRRPEDVGAVSWRYLLGDVACPNAERSAVEWAVDDLGLVVDSTITEHALVGLANTLVRSDAAASADSQPYAVLSAVRVDSGRSPQQEFSDQSTDDYARLVTRVARDPNTVDDLSATVRKRADSSALGPPAVLTVAEFDALTDVNGMRRWDVIFGPAATTAGLQCYVEFTCPGAPGEGWTVAYLTTDGGAGDVATYGGTTDRATIDGVEDSDADLDVTIAILPDPPATASSSVGTVAIPADGAHPALGDIEYAAVVWDATALAGLFGRYVVERSIDGGPWVVIGYPDAEGTVEFDDYEGPRGVECCYRVSVERDDGTRSEPTDAGCVTCEAPGCAVIFASNESPTLSRAYRINGGSRAWKFLDADGVVFRQLYRRDYQVAFAPLERAGDQFEMVVLLQFNLPPPVGRAMFDDLLAIANDPSLSYVCVLDEVGGRWFGELQVSEGTRDEPQGQYGATVLVTETTATSSTPP
jgi:hypothetical protein